MSLSQFLLTLATLSLSGLAACSSFFSGHRANEACSTVNTSYSIPDGYARVQANARGHINILLNNVYVGRAPMDKLIPAQTKPMTADVDVGGQVFPIINFWEEFEHFNTNLFNVRSKTTVKLGTFLSDGSRDDYDSSSCNMGQYGKVPRNKTHLVIHTNPEGLIVLMDGRTVGMTPIDQLVSSSHNPPLLVFTLPNGKKLTDDEYKVMLMGGDTIKLYKDATGQINVAPPINPVILQPTIAPGF